MDIEALKRHLMSPVLPPKSQALQGPGLQLTSALSVACSNKVLAWGFPQEQSYLGVHYLVYIIMIQITEKTMKEFT